MTSTQPPHQRSKRFRFKNPHPTPKPLTNKSTPLSSPPSPSPTKALDPDPEPTFAQSLFASLSSSSAAEFWADIYGQPIHVYPRPVVSGQQLSDDEYVAYVQRRLWENTREGLEERARERVKEQERERERVQEERRRQRKRKREVQEQERDALDAEREREDRLWEERVEQYIAAWNLGSDIPWPCVGVEAGDEGQFDAESVGGFLFCVARTMGVSFEQLVKVERVRWHPDKILQRFGDGASGEERMKKVNEVWRAVDSIWRRIKD